MVDSAFWCGEMIFSGASEIMAPKFYTNQPDSAETSKPT